MVVRRERHLRSGFEFRLAISQCLPCGLPYSRFSVAVPLGINGWGPKTCGSKNRAGRTPPPREARKLTEFVAIRPGARPTKAIPQSPPSLSGSALASEQVEACGAHSNVSCGPPRPEASARATLWVATARPNSVTFVLGAPPMRRSRRGRRFCESLYSLSLKALSRVRPTAAPLSLRHVFARLTRLLLSNKSRPPWRERVRRTGAPFG